MENHLENWTMNIYMGKEVASHHCCKPKEIQGLFKKAIKKRKQNKAKKDYFSLFIIFSSKQGHSKE